MKTKSIKLRKDLEHFNRTGEIRVDKSKQSSGAEIAPVKYEKGTWQYEKYKQDLNMEISQLQRDLKVLKESGKIEAEIKTNKSIDKRNKDNGDINSLSVESDWLSNPGTKWKRIIVRKNGDMYVEYLGEKHTIKPDGTIEHHGKVKGGKKDLAPNESVKVKSNGKMPEYRTQELNSTILSEQLRPKVGERFGPNGEWLYVNEQVVWRNLKQDGFGFYV